MQLVMAIINLYRLVEFQAQQEMRPKILFLLWLCASVALCGEAEQGPQDSIKSTNSSTNSGSKIYSLSFEEFKQTYSKAYTSVAQQNYRQLIFEQNLEALNNHNSNPNRKYNMKPNAFLDVARDEFKMVYGTIYTSDQHSKTLSSEITHHLSLKQQSATDPATKTSSQTQESLRTDSQRQTNEGQNEQQEIEKQTQNKIENDIPGRRLQLLTMNNKNSSKDIKVTSTLEQTKTNSTLSEDSSKALKQAYISWQYYSGTARFQGFCGACYVFSTVDTIATLNAIYTYGFHYPLSVQQVIDCADNGLMFGCSGGYLEGPLTHIIAKGLVSEASYPFTSGSKGFAGKCLRQNGGQFKIKSFTSLEEGSCLSVINALYSGPVSAGIAGYHLRFYDDGIFECQPNDQLDHAVMVVGYDGSKGWRIKNSWGQDWGQNGYGWIAEGNTCGICNMTVKIVV